MARAKESQEDTFSISVITRSVILPWLDFPEERKQLLEMVGPELQSIYDDIGVEVRVDEFNHLNISFNELATLRSVQFTYEDDFTAHTGITGGYAIWNQS